MNSLINTIENSLIHTNNYSSKITDEILKLEGMTGKKTRHFYNNICSMENARYLEVGSYKGSSICSAMCNNNMTCLAIDNWSEFGNNRDEFLNNFNKFKGNNNASFIEKDCWDVDVSTIGKFNIYMYDGNHTQDSHYKALNHYLPCLDNEFIYLVDDWNEEEVRNGTFQSIKDNNCIVKYQKEINTGATGGWGVPYEWWNGIAIFVLKK
tara:strand:- start:867 stop:1493 length:627 start_codon:yes stop_codon:yes gene_type:complete